MHISTATHYATHTDLNFRYSPDTLQTRKPFFHSFKLLPKPRDAPDTDVILSLAQISKIQIQYIYTPDAKVILLFIQIRIQLQLGYAPDTDAIPLLIQIQSPDTVQIRSRHGYHYDTHSFDL